MNVKKREKLFQVKKFFKGRKNGGYYDLFLSTFVKQVVGITTWNEKLKNQNLKGNNLFTPSDEAFAMIVLDNNFEYWSEMFENNSNNVPFPIKK